MTRKNEVFELKDVEFKHETSKALLIVYDDEEYWIPLSQVEEIHRAEGRIVMSAWIAKQKGFL